jgi:hypothetical protein
MNSKKFAEAVVPNHLWMWIRQGVDFGCEVILAYIYFGSLLAAFET